MEICASCKYFNPIEGSCDKFHDDVSGWDDACQHWEQEDGEQE